MREVAPGSETGLYYILVGNLHWKCTWQDLKDFTRHHPDGDINVEHAYVYPTSNSGPTCSGAGWVRVRGRDNFKRAVAYLNGANLGGRSLVADGRNETQSVPVKDDIPDPQPSIHIRQHSHGREDSHPAPPQQQYPGSSNPYSTYTGLENHEDWNQSQQVSPSYAQSPSNFSSSSSSFAGSGYQSFNSPQDRYVSTTEFYPTPGPTGTNPGTMGSTPYPNMLPFGYVPMPPTMENSSISRIANIPPGVNTSSGFVIPLYRKVVITKLGYEVTNGQLKDLIYDICSQFRATTDSERLHPVRDIAIPRSQTDGKAKGQAYVTLDSEALATYVVEQVDGILFRGRTLAAKLAKEGTVPEGGFARSGGHSSRARGGSGRGDMRDSRRGVSGDRDGGGQPMVVDGSGSGSMRSGSYSSGMG